MRIKTDHKWRHFKYRDEVPAEVLGSQFEYQDRNAALDGFFQYKGTWYHLDQFMALDQQITASSPLAVWDGYVADSFSSGVFIKLSSDGESYQIATYFT